MWVFGFGSLMWDGWESRHGCIRKLTATLPGFCRSFTKESVRNWGTPTRPGPTLNIERHPTAACVGVAFEFPDEKRDAVTAVLRAREGKGFALEEHTVILDGGVRCI